MHYIKGKTAKNLALYPDGLLAAAAGTAKTLKCAAGALYGALIFLNPQNNCISNFLG